MAIYNQWYTKYLFSILIHSTQQWHKEYQKLQICKSQNKSIGFGWYWYIQLRVKRSKPAKKFIRWFLDSQFNKYVTVGLKTIWAIWVGDFYNVPTRLLHISNVVHLSMVRHRDKKRYLIGFDYTFNHSYDSI